MRHQPFCCRLRSKSLGLAFCESVCFSGCVRAEAFQSINELVSKLVLLRKPNVKSLSSANNVACHCFIHGRYMLDANFDLLFREIITLSKFDQTKTVLPFFFQILVCYVWHILNFFSNLKVLESCLCHFLHVRIFSENQRYLCWLSLHNVKVNWISRE